jgi:hypothetical protein
MFWFVGEAVAGRGTAELAEFPPSFAVAGCCGSSVAIGLESESELLLLPNLIRSSPELRLSLTDSFSTSRATAAIPYKEERRKTYFFLCNQNIKVVVYNSGAAAVSNSA